MIVAATVKVSAKNTATKMTSAELYRSSTSPAGPPPPKKRNTGKFNSHNNNNNKVLPSITSTSPSPCSFQTIPPPSQQETFVGNKISTKMEYLQPSSPLIEEYVNGSDTSPLTLLVKACSNLEPPIKNGKGGRTNTVGNTILDIAEGEILRSGTTSCSVENDDKTSSCCWNKATMTQSEERIAISSSTSTTTSSTRNKTPHNAPNTPTPCSSHNAKRFKESQNMVGFGIINSSPNLNYCNNSKKLIKKQQSGGEMTHLGSNKNIMIPPPKDNYSQPFQDQVLEQLPQHLYPTPTPLYYDILNATAAAYYASAFMPPPPSSFFNIPPLSPELPPIPITTTTTNIPRITTTSYKSEQNHRSSSSSSTSILGGKKECCNNYKADESGVDDISRRHKNGNGLSVLSSPPFNKLCACGCGAPDVASFLFPHMFNNNYFHGRPTNVNNPLPPPPPSYYYSKEDEDPLNCPFPTFSTGSSGGKFNKKQHSSAAVVVDTVESLNNNSSRLYSPYDPPLTLMQQYNSCSYLNPLLGMGGAGTAGPPYFLPPTSYLAAAVSQYQQKYMEDYYYLRFCFSKGISSNSGNCGTVDFSNHSSPTSKKSCTTSKVTSSTLPIVPPIPTNSTLLKNDNDVQYSTTPASGTMNTPPPAPHSELIYDTIRNSVTDDNTDHFIDNNINNTSLPPPITKNHRREKLSSFNASSTSTLENHCRFPFLIPPTRPQLVIPPSSYCSPSIPYKSTSMIKASTKNDSHINRTKSLSMGGQSFDASAAHHLMLLNYLKLNPFYENFLNMYYRPPPASASPSSNSSFYKNYSIDFNSNGFHNTPTTTIPTDNTLLRE